ALLPSRSSAQFADPKFEFVNYACVNNTPDDATDLEITLNKAPQQGTSRTMGKHVGIAAKTIKFSLANGLVIAAGNSDSGVIVVPFQRETNGDPVENKIEKIFFSFPNPKPNVEYVIPKVGGKGEKKPTGSIDGFVEISNADTNIVYFTNVA